MDPSANLKNLVRIRTKLEEAEQIAKESGFHPDPTSPEAGSGMARPATVTPLIVVAIRQCNNAIARVKEQMGMGGDPTS
jgi:hypothetical protein